MKKTLITLIIANAFTATAAFAAAQEGPGMRGLNLAGRITAIPVPTNKLTLIAITLAAVYLPAIRLTRGWRSKVDMTI